MLTVGELRKYIDDLKLSDDTPVFLRVNMPESAKTDSFEDEYGPGFQEHNVTLLNGFGSLVFGDLGPIDTQVAGQL